MENEIRKTAYKTFAKLFYYPDGELIKLLHQGVITNFISSLRLISADTLYDWIQTYDSKDKLLEVLQVEYTQLFITNFPAVPAPIYKSFYKERELIGKSTEEIIDIYNAHDFNVSENMTEPADHLAIELEFIYRLIEEGVSIKEQMDFINKNILDWIEEFANNVNEHALLPFYGFLIEVLTELLKLDVLQNGTKLTEAEK